MTAMLSLTANCVTKFRPNLVSFFTMAATRGSTILDNIAREIGALERQGRSFFFGAFMHSAVSLIASNALHQQSYHLEKFRQAYCLYGDDEYSISNKGFNKRLDDEKMNEAAVEILNQIMAHTNRKLSRHKRHIVDQNLKLIFNRLGVSDLVLVDGSDTPLREGTRDKFPNKGSGRNKKSGKPAVPAIKFHAGFSLLEQIFLYLECTEAVADEREHILLDRLKGKLLIGDRGYISEKMENELTEKGIKWIIKGKVNMTSGIILEAYGDGGRPLPECVGKKYGDVKDQITDKEFDVTVETKSGGKCRIVRTLNPNIDSGRDENDSDDRHRYVYLRTNIDRKTLSVSELFMLYRIRWSCEIFFETLKQGNCFRSINSSSKNIILTFFVLNLIAAMIKMFLAVSTAIKNKVKMQDISILKISTSGFTVFAEFFRNLGRVQKSLLYEIINRTEKLIMENCMRSHVSKSNIEKGKSYPHLLQQIADSINKRSGATGKIA